MRSQTPIQQQRTTQTQQRRSGPHNPSLARRIQPSGQRTSPLRQMQQQTRQRTRRKRKSTPLPEKRGRKRQTTHRSHANTTHRHMVNHTPPFQQKKGGAQRKARKERRERRERRESKRRRDKPGDTMVFGDNVRARMAARALPRTPTTKEEKRKTEKRERQATRPPTAIPQPTTQHNKTTHTPH